MEEELLESLPSDSRDLDNKRQSQKADSVFWETVKVLLIAAVIIVPVRFFVIQPFVVKGESMESNFHGGDYLIVNELNYRLNDFQRGEVIVFKINNNLGEYFIKRVIGLPGETIEIKNGQVRIYNAEYPGGFILDEAMYLDDGVSTGGNMKVTLGASELFVMGDNRNRSSDSRVWGSLDEHDVVGRVWIRLLPFSDRAIIN